MTEKEWSGYASIYCDLQRYLVQICNAINIGSMKSTKSWVLVPGVHCLYQSAHTFSVDNSGMQTC